MAAQEAAAAATMAVQTVDGMLDGVIITDLRGRITHTNKALTEYFGWGREVLGELATKLVVDRDGRQDPARPHRLPGTGLRPGPGVRPLDQRSARGPGTDQRLPHNRSPGPAPGGHLGDPGHYGPAPGRNGPGGGTAAPPVPPGGAARLRESEGPGLFHQVCQPLFPGTIRGPRRPAVLPGYARVSMLPAKIARS